MTRLATLFLLLAQFGFANAAAAQDAKAVIAEAMQAMGMTPTFTAVTFAGSATYGNFMQSRRLSVGLETPDDILWDIDQALEKIGQ